MTLLVVVKTRYNNATSIGNISAFLSRRADTIAQNALPYRIYSQSGVKNRLIKNTITKRATTHLINVILVHL